jgi:Major Facilitator Superfamily
MNIAVPTIQIYFDTGLGGIQWILNAYTLALGSLILVSGGLTDRFGLKQIYLLGMYLFLAMLPLIGIAIILTRRALPARERVPGGDRQLDYPGFLLSISGLALLTFGLIRFSGEGAPDLPLMSFAAGALLLTLFVRVEKSCSGSGRESLIPMSIFTPVIRAANIATFSLYFAFSSALFLLSLNLQQLQGFRPGTAGVLILPATILIPFLSGPSGLLTDRRGPLLQKRTGPLIFAAGALLLLSGGNGARYIRDLLPGMLLLGLGMVVVIPAITTSAIAVPAEKTGTASGINNAAARISGLFAVALGGLVLAAGYRYFYGRVLERLALEPDVRGQLLSQAARMLSAPLPDLPGSAAQGVPGARREAWASAYRLAMSINVLAALAAAWAGWRIPKRLPG